MSRVAVVVLNWNGWRDTLTCLASLYALREAPTQIVVVDNASTDDSVQRIRAAYPGVELLQSGANLGFGGGCNVGIRHAMLAGADYVWLVNSDATAHPDALVTLLMAASQDPGLGAVGSLIFDAAQPSHLQIWGGGQVNLWLGQSRPLRSPGEVDFLSGASLLLRISALHNTGLFDDQTYFMYWEDTDLSFRLRQKGWRLGVAEDSRVWHQESSSLGKGSPLLDTYFVRSALRFFRRYAPVPIVPSICMLARMVLKRALLGHGKRIQAIWVGVRGR